MKKFKVRGVNTGVVGINATFDMGIYATFEEAQKETERRGFYRVDNVKVAGGKISWCCSDKCAMVEKDVLIVTDGNGDEMVTFYIEEIDECEHKRQQDFEMRLETYAYNKGECTNGTYDNEEMSVPYGTICLDCGMVLSRLRDEEIREVVKQAMISFDAYAASIKEKVKAGEVI